MPGQELTRRLTVRKSSSSKDRGVKKKKKFKNCPKVRNYFLQYSYAVSLPMPRTLIHCTEPKCKLANAPESENILLLKKHLQSYSRLGAAYASFITPCVVSIPWLHFSEPLKPGLLSGQCEKIT